MLPPNPAELNRKRSLAKTQRRQELTNAHSLRTLRGSYGAVFRFRCQVSGFGCQGTELLNPDT
ncbi:hypothetical protein D1AOALGA4SA_5101 [Olavius algarvensis Delta 1 endosymbiont]|nr:hypothetical protein D1AOALGA4SA_5101 [Olavius algarvensis Delta 1 endosymbiont]